jgi:ELWxxDGT repeat protein
MSQTLYFTANDGVHGLELWRSDGTAAGTAMVADLRPGVASSSPSSYVTLGGTAYFTAVDGSGDGLLYKTDGTAAGTVVVKNFGFLNAVVEVQWVDGALYAWTSNGLWRSDGTAAGTVQISSASVDGALVAAGNLFFFTATDAAHGKEVWVSDGTAGGTHLTRDINPGSATSNPLGIAGSYGLSLFIAQDTAGFELWRSDGTAAGTFILNNTLDQISNTVEIDNETYFGGGFSVFSFGLYKTDGTVAGTSLVKSFSNGPGQLAALGSLVYFEASDGIGGLELWRSD